MSRTETIGQTDSGLLIVQHHDGMSSDPQWHSRAWDRPRAKSRAAATTGHAARARAKRRAKRKRTGR